MNQLFKYSNLFSEITVRGKIYKNRIIASPITANQVSNKGCITDAGIAAYEEKARGGFAQVTITESFVDFEHAARHDHGIDLVSKNLPTYYFDSALALTSAIKAHGAIASIQFNHVGNVNDPSTTAGGKNPIGPCHIVKDNGVVIDEMDENMMRHVAENFARACRNAKAVGFDGVNLHGGHGWLLSQFISPLSNFRKDKYGGSMENRARFPLMVLDYVRKAVGEDFIIEYRVSAEEGEGGLCLDDTIEFCKLIQDKVDIIHVTNGIYHKHVETKAFSSMFHPHGCNVEAAAAIKRLVHVPVAVVGGINDPDLAEHIIASGKADFVALGRQQFADPEFPIKALQGREDEIAPCLRCSCFNPLPPSADDRPDAIEFLCTVNPRSGQEFRLSCYPRPRSSKKVLVVGGGPAGMYAAITAAERGHEVTLAEKEARLGGLIKFTDIDVHKDDLRRYKNSLIIRLSRSNVKIELNTLVTSDYIHIKKPDRIILAVGSTPIIPKIKGIENAKHALSVYDEKIKIGKKIVMIGGGLIGCETGLHLAELGHNVHIIEMMDDVARDAGMSHKIAIMPLLNKMLTYETNSRCIEIKTDSVTVLDKNGEEKIIEADTIVYAIGMKSNKDVVSKIKKSFPAAVPAGDCVKPQKVLEAVRAGMYAALDIL